MSLESEMRVSIYQEPCFGGLSINMWSRSNGKTYMVQPMEVIFKEVSEFATIERPTLRLSAATSPMFLAAFAEALDKHGVKTDSDAKIAGTLEATRAHLADMKKLVFRGK